MTLRSKLFATVALPVLAVSFVVNPAMAGSRNATWLMAQAVNGDVNGDGQLSDDELLLLQQQGGGGEPQAEAPAEEAPAAEAPQPEAAPAPEPVAEEPPPAEPAPQAEPVAEQAPAVEQAPAEEPAQPRKKKPAAEEQQQEQAPAAEEAAPPAEEPAKPSRKKKPAAEEPAAPAAEEPAAPAEEPAKPSRKKKPAAEEPAAEQPAAPAAEEPAAPAEEPVKKGGKKKPAAEEPAAEQPAAPAAEEPAAPAEEPVKKGGKKKPAAEEPAAEQPAAPAAEAPAGEQPATEAPAAPVEQNSGAAQPPADGAAAEAPAAEAPLTEKAKEEKLVAPIQDKRTIEQKAEIAKDPAKTAETVVLPVDNGAAVLDSDKDADNTGAAGIRAKRAKAREQEKVAPPPKTDADAQAAMPVLEQKAVNAAIEEKGKKVSEAPAFAVPGVTNVQNNTVNNTTVNNTVNNTVTNNTVVNTVTVVKQVDNSTVLNVGDRTIVRSDDRRRLRGEDSNESYSERLSRGRSRETIVRGDGTRIVTIYNAYGDIIQRSRVTRDGEEYVMIYAPEADTEKPREIYDAGYDLPPMRLTVPVDDYIVSTREMPDEDYYTFLEKPPVERVERVYSIDEVKYSARIRDKVRRIDLDTITFATGSAEVPLAQAKTLRSVADAILKVLKKDPGETFLIEGHTDAVGSDQSNLVLSDKRAASVAELLTDVYGIPPENLTTQGYGERYLKIRTAGPEQQNRRVTIRRVTALIRPVAQAQ